ncbi:MAG: TrkA family potassium uptake protein [Clostridia bacterium]|nr:TrkA family potassium uptake protein [Clostridia bacterium]
MGFQKSYAVFGLGNFGTAVAKELAKSGAEVLAVDLNESVVHHVTESIPLCKCADVTDPDVLKQLGIANFDTVIVAMAENLEASVMAVTLCKEAGVPEVIAKCANEMHRRILLRVGADTAIIPEKESGKRLAKNLLSAGFSEMIGLSDKISMVELKVRSEWVGKTLIQLQLRKKYEMNVVALRTGGTITTAVDPTLPLTSEMQLIVIAETAKLRKLR